MTNRRYSSDVFKICAIVVFMIFGIDFAFSKETGLAQYAGSWAVKPNLCGKSPTLENTFPLEISKEGKNISIFEQSCDIVKIQSKDQRSYVVRLVCETEGEPEFIDEIYTFTSTKVTVQNRSNGKKSEFFRCEKLSEKAKDKSEVHIKPNSIKIVKGRCLMDYCNFTKLGTIVSRFKTKSGELLRVQYRSASVHAPQTNSYRDQYADIKIPSFEKSSQGELVAHCSKTRPFTAFNNSDGFWHGLLLDLPEGGAGYTAGSAAVFWALCEKINVAADLVYYETSQFAKLGYGNQWKANQGDDMIVFESIDDILALANF
jgi:hypothetical protein